MNEAERTAIFINQPTVTISLDTLHVGKDA